MDRLRRAIGDFSEKREIPVVQEGATVDAALEVMRTLDTHCVFVERSEVLVGVFTERDLLTRVVANKLAVASTPIAEVMTRDPETLAATDHVAYAINRMAIGGFRNVPIVDSANKLVSALSVRDVVEHLSDVIEDLDDVEDEYVEIGGGD